MDLSPIIKNLDTSKNFSLVVQDVKKIKESYIELLKEINASSDCLVINFRFPSIEQKKELETKGININKLSFIDGLCISADIIPDGNDIEYLMSQKDLDGILVSMDSIFAKSEKIGFIVIDLLDPLLIYNSIENIKKMLDNLKKYSINRKTNVAIFATKQNESLTSSIKPKFDRILEE